MTPWERSEKVRTFARALLVLAIASSIACAQKDWIDRTLVTENVTGAWTGSFGEGSSYRALRLDLRQEGSKVSGVATMLLGGNYGGGDTSPLEGNVAGDVFTFKMLRGSANGELTVSGDDMSGQILWIYGNRRALLRRVDASSRTESPPR